MYRDPLWLKSGIDGCCMARTFLTEDDIYGGDLSLDVAIRGSTG
jgi:hypothetical protein